MNEYYKARLKGSGSHIDKEFLIWIRSMSAEVQILNEQEQIKDILDLVDAYRVVKGEREVVI